MGRILRHRKHLQQMDGIQHVQTERHKLHLSNYLRVVNISCKLNLTSEIPEDRSTSFGRLLKYGIGRSADEQQCLYAFLTTCHCIT